MPSPTRQYERGEKNAFPHKAVWEKIEKRGPPPQGSAQEQEASLTGQCGRVQRHILRRVRISVPSP
jgi:hypothetical protein